MIGQLLTRQMTLDAAGYGVLSALGMTRGGLFALAASPARLALVTVAGGVIAVVIAIAASPLMPIGPAGWPSRSRGRPEPGRPRCGPGLIACLPLLVLAAGSGGTPPGPRDRPARPTRPRPRGFPAGAALGRLDGAGQHRRVDGVRAGHGRTAVPVAARSRARSWRSPPWSPAVFGASLIGLVSTPRLYGQRWEQQLDLGFASVPEPSCRHPGAAAGPDQLRGRQLRRHHVQGRSCPPSASPRCAAGTSSRCWPAGRAAGTKSPWARRRCDPAPPDRTADRGPGQRGDAPDARDGTVVFAAFGRGGFESTDLGSGAVLSAPVLSQPEPQTGCPRPPTCYSLLLRYRPGTTCRPRRPG